MVWHHVKKRTPPERYVLITLDITCMTEEYKMGCCPMLKLLPQIKYHHTKQRYENIAYLFDFLFTIRTWDNPWPCNFEFPIFLKAKIPFPTPSHFFTASLGFFSLDLLRRIEWGPRRPLKVRLKGYQLRNHWSQRLLVGSSGFQTVVKGGIMGTTSLQR